MRSLPYAKRVFFLQYMYPTDLYVDISIIETSDVSTTHNVLGVKKLLLFLIVNNFLLPLRMTFKLW